MPLFRFLRSPWFYILFVAPAAALWLTQVPSCCVINDTTHYISQPRMPDGSVDYFTEIKKLYQPEPFDPENNGYRVLLETFGLRAVKSGGSVSPDNLGEICNAFHLDFDQVQNAPYADFKFDLWSHLHDLKLPLERLKELYPEWEAYHKKAMKKMKSQMQEGEIGTSSFTDDYYKKLTAFPWSKADNPEAAEYLNNVNEALDALGKAFRYPQFQPYYVKFTAKDSKFADVDCRQIGDMGDCFKKWVTLLRFRINALCYSPDAGREIRRCTIFKPPGLSSFMRRNALIGSALP